MKEREENNKHRAELTAHQVERGLRLSLVHGVLFNIFMATTGGMFIIGYALLLGASNTQIGILAALPPLASFAQILSSYLVEKRRERKRFCLFTNGIGIGVWIFVIAVPFLVPSHSSWLQLSVLFILLEISYLFNTLSMNAWLSWMGDLVPGIVRGRFFGKRTFVIQLVGLLLAVLEGTFLDYVKETQGFSLLFGFGIIFGFLALLPLSKQPEPLMEKTGDGIPFLSIIKRSLRDRNLRGLILFTIAWMFAMLTASPFFNVFMLKTLELKYMTVALVWLVWGVVALLTVTKWGYWIDKYGSRNALILGSLGLAFFPVGWIFVNETNWIYLLPIFCAVGGFIGTGQMLASFVILLDITPRENRSVYIATFWAITGEFAAFAPVLGGVVADYLKTIPLKTVGLTGLKLNFALSCSLRLLSLLLLKKVGKIELMRKEEF